jgi:predicted esterase
MQAEFIHEFVAAHRDGNGLTLLLLHGTGGNERDLLSMGPLVAPGAAMLSVRGKVLEDGKPRFFRRFSEGVFDVEDVKFRANELADFVGQAAGRYGFDGRRVIAVGYSNGANIATAVLLLRPETLSAAALFRPMTPFVPETTPCMEGKPIFISAGREDPVVPQAESARLAKLLAGAGAEVVVNWSPDGHWLENGEIAAARQWLMKTMRRAAAR